MIDNLEIYTELIEEFNGKSKYINIGNLLKNRRLDMNISIDSMAMALKLSSMYISMVEDGDYDSVAQKIYYFGYIRNLARYLKLDEEMILRYLVTEVKIDEKTLKDNIDNADKNILNRSIISNKDKYRSNKNNNNSLYIAVVAVFILTSFGFIIYNQSQIKNDPMIFTSKKQNIKL
jgi:cytoskeletal protein RodZ